jgi:hypothetical protein
MIVSRACKSFTFEDGSGLAAVLSETQDRFYIRISIGEQNVFLDAEQFSELCGLDGYGGLGVHARPEPEPVQADPAPVEG